VFREILSIFIFRIRHQTSWTA